MTYEEPPDDPRPRDGADRAEQRAKRRRYEESVDEREWNAGSRGIGDETEVRVQDVDHVLSRGEADRGGAHVDHPVDGLVERGVAAHAAGDDDVLHDLFVQSRERDEREKQG